HTGRQSQSARLRFGKSVGAGRGIVQFFGVANIVERHVGWRDSWHRALYESGTGKGTNMPANSRIFGPSAQSYTKCSPASPRSMEKRSRTFSVESFEWSQIGRHFLKRRLP